MTTPSLPSRLRARFNGQMAAGEPGENLFLEAAEMIESQQKLTTELIDIAICETEHVAQKLRGFAGYPQFPYPPLEPAG